MIKIQHISKEHIVSRVGGNIVSDMGGEKVMLSVQQGKYYNLGDIGGEIWEQINEPILVGELISILVAKYDVHKDDCEQQVMAFLDHLGEEELIKVWKEGGGSEED